MKNINDDDAFAERIARPLRAPEQTRPDFDIRVMSSLHGAVTSGPRRVSGSWWRRSRLYRLTPLAQLAMAAGIVMLMAAAWAGSRLTNAQRASGSQTVATTTDALHVVRFVFVDSTASRVALVGSFNQWRRDLTVFEPTEVPGVWMVEVALPPGRHEYAFVVASDSTERWVADPFAPRRRDDFGTESSVISIRPRSS
jgi:hypothetical protein